MALVFSSEPTSRPASITLTLPDTCSDATAEELRAHLESKIQDGGPPIRVVVERFPAPPGPTDSRVTVTGGRRSPKPQAAPQATACPTCGATHR